MTKVMKTDRLKMRPYKVADRRRLAELLTNDEIKKTFMIPEFETEEEITDMLDKLQKYSYSDAHFERGIFVDDTLIGFINDVEINKDVIEIGFVIHPFFQKQGYATEML